MKKVLIVCAHADDEILGCFGAIRYHLMEGDKVLVQIVTDRAINHKSKKEKLHTEELISAFIDAVGGVKSVNLKYIFSHAKDEDPSALVDYIKVIEKLRNSYRPDRVYTHYEHDLNQTHQLVSHAVRIAYRPQSVSSLIYFEVPSTTELSSIPFNPNLYFDLNNSLALKILFMTRFYSKEMRDYPNPRSVRGITSYALFRGMQCGRNGAEAYQIVREVQ